MKCGTCGNDYDKAFMIIDSEGVEHVFDAFECAIHALAPTCDHCGCRIVGHGIEAEDQKMFCCAHCAQEQGVSQAQDRVRG